MDLELSGKIAIVTGGSRGIGKAIARELAREGVDVATAARGGEALEATAQELTGETSRRCIPITVDTGNEESVQSMVQQAVAQLGNLDILVNCAARVGGGPAPNLAEITEEYFWLVLLVLLMPLPQAPLLPFRNNSAKQIRWLDIKVDHVAFVVKNLDREIEFYRDILGLEFILRRIWDYEYVRQMVGIPYAVLDIALLKLPGKEGSPLAEDRSLTPGKGDAMLELIEYNQPKSNPVDDSPNTLGNAHITSLVDDMDAIIARLREANATFRSRNLYIFSGYTWPQTQYDPLLTLAHNTLP